MKELKIFFKIICVVGIVLLILGIVAAFMLQEANAEMRGTVIMQENSNQQQQTQIDQNHIILDEVEADVAALKEERDWLLNMDQNIADLKQEYAQNIRTLEDKILAGESDVKIAYLTFDDGPYKQTEQYLAILDQYDIKATFFVIGRPDRADYYRLIRDKGHTIANHTYSHGIRKGLYDSPQSFIEQVNKLEDLLYEETGVITNIVRFPGGSSTAKKQKEAIVELLREEGYGYVDWDSMTGDGGDRSLTPEKAKQTLLRTAKGDKISVVLMHDYSSHTLKALPSIIEELSAQGYIFLPLHYESVKILK